jgi:acyl carrier protein
VDTTEIRQFLRRAVSKELNLSEDRITDRANIRELPGIESVRILRIIVAVEREYSIQLDDEVVFQVNTIEELSNAVSELVESGKPI